MAHKRRILILSLEGIDSWVDSSSNAFQKTFFSRYGTCKELWRFDDEEIEKVMTAIYEATSN